MEQKKLEMKVKGSWSVRHFLWLSLHAVPPSGRLTLTSDVERCTSCGELVCSMFCNRQPKEHGEEVLKTT